MGVVRRQDLHQIRLSISLCMSIHKEMYVERQMEDGVSTGERGRLMEFCRGGLPLRDPQGKSEREKMKKFFCFSFCLGDCTRQSRKEWKKRTSFCSEKNSLFLHQSRTSLSLQDLPRLLYEGIIHQMLFISFHI